MKRHRSRHLGDALSGEGTRCRPTKHATKRPTGATQEKLASHRLADLALLAVTLIWGVTFPVVKAALTGASPLLFVAVRMSLAAMVVVAVFRPCWRRLPLRLWFAGAMLGLTLGGGYVLQTVGLVYISPAISAFLTSLAVILVPVLLALFWSRRLHPRAWIGAAVALLGLALLLLAPGAGHHPVSALWLGYGLTSLCAILFALNIILIGEWSPVYRFGDLAALMIGFAAAVSWAVVPAETSFWQNSGAVWGAVVLTAVFATALAFTTQAWAQQHTPAAHAAVIFAFEPVFAALASWWWMQQRLRFEQWIGAALVVLATVIVEQRTPEPQPGSEAAG